MPLALVNRPITLLRLRVLPASTGTTITPASLVVRRVRVLEYLHGRIVVRRTPPVRVVAEPVPPLTAASSPTITAASLGS